MTNPWANWFGTGQANANAGAQPQQPNWFGTGQANANAGEQPHPQRNIDVTEFAGLVQPYTKIHKLSET